MESKRGSSGYEKLVDDKPPISPSSRPFRLRFHRILGGGCVTNKTDSEVMSPVSPMPRKKRNAFSFDENDSKCVLFINYFFNSLSLLFSSSPFSCKKNEYL